MNISDAAKALSKAAAYDNRKVTEAAAAAWAEAIDPRVGIGDALDAISAHYGESREWVMPADINRRVRAVWRERVRADGVPPIPGGLSYPQEQAWRPVYHARIRQGSTRAEAESFANAAIGVSELPAAARPVGELVAGQVRRWSE